MIRRNYLSVDIGSGRLRGVSMRRRGRGHQLQGGRTLVLGEGVLVPSLREPNIREPDRFVEDLREVLDPLAGKEERISLSLPDASGRILLTEVEAPFKTRSEGIDMLKWQLRNSLPVDPELLRLDFQVMERSESGASRLLVGLSTLPVIDQYEELAARAGYSATLVGFHSLNMYNFYRTRIDPGGDFFLVGIEGPSLCLQLFQGGVMRFQRSRDLEASAEEMFREIGRTLAGCQEAVAGTHRAAVFLHSDWDDWRPLLEALEAAFERQVHLLDPHLERLADARLDLERGESRALVGAVGAAERMM